MICSLMHTVGHEIVCISELNALAKRRFIMVQRSKENPMDNPFQTRRAKVAAVAAAVLVLGALLYAVRSGFVPRVSNADEGEFLLVDASDRELDGSPALALTFTLPLDARKSYDKSIRVFEMPSPPARPAESRRFFEEDAARGNGGTIVSAKPEDTNPQGGSVVKGAWAVGENPRLIFFPNIKPATRYVVLISPGLE